MSSDPAVPPAAAVGGKTGSTGGRVGHSRVSIEDPNSADVVGRLLDFFCSSSDCIISDVWLQEQKRYAE